MILLKGAGTSTGPNVFGETNVEFVGASIGVDSATLPAHVAGDLIIGIAWNYTTTPNDPSGWTSHLAGGTTDFFRRVSYKVATNSSTVSGTWTDALVTMFVVVRGQASVSPLNTLSSMFSISSPSSLTNIQFRAVNPFDVTDKTSSLMFLVLRASTNTSIDVEPRLCQKQYADNSGSFRGVVHQTLNGVAEYPTNERAITSAGRWLYIGLEILSS